MGVNSRDIGELVLEVADTCLKGPRVNTVNEYFAILEKALKNIEDLQKFEEACKELKENLQGYNGVIYGQGCLKIATGVGLAATGTYMGVQLSTHGAAILGFPLLVLSYYALTKPFRGVRRRIQEKDRCVDAPELKWRWAIHSYKKDIQKRIEEFYSAT